MKREEHKGIITKLIGMVASEHQATASELLTSLSDDYETVLTESESTSERLQNLTNDNENLRKANMKLFLRVGETDKELHKADTPEPDKQEEEKPLSFDNLFNEKGELL